jgi:hypothetical protein
MPKKHAGLPRSLLVEIARDPKFIELQKQLNEIEENSATLTGLRTQLQTLEDKLAQNEQSHKDRLKEVIKLLEMQKQDAAGQETLTTQRLQIERKIQKQVLLRQILAEARSGLIKESERFETLWEQRKSHLKGRQKSVIQASFQNLEKDLNHWLDQSELLFYEIHNGAGEHLRYQMAATNENQMPGNKPSKFKKEDKDLQWAFDGEIWEDEVGHYRSSLKNVCPQEENLKVSEITEPNAAATVAKAGKEKP